MKIYKKDGVSGQTKIEIQVTGPNNVLKKIEIDENNHVILKNGNQYHIPLSVDETNNLEGDRMKRSFMFGRQNEVRDPTIYDIMSPSINAINWNTLLSQRDLNERLVGGLAMHTSKDDVMNPMIYNTMTEDMKKMSWQNMNVDVDRATTNMMMIKVLMRMFDQKVMMHLLNSYGIDQTHNEMILDRILTTESIFDKRVLMEIIQDSFLRNLLIKHRILDSTIMEMNRQVTLYELEHFINRQILKNWMITFGCCNKDILRRMVHETIIENMMTTEKMNHLWLLKVLKDSMLTRVLVQKGIFNENILEQCLFNIRRNMMTGDDLLKQLINRRMLKVYLMQKGFVDMTLLDRMMENEILGLRVLLDVLMLNETPKMTYRQTMGVMVNKPDWILGQMGRVPLDNAVVRTTMSRRMFGPNTGMDQFYNIRDPTTRYGIWDILSDQSRGLDRQMMIENLQDLEERRMLASTHGVMM